VDQEIKNFTEERGVDLTIIQQKQVLEMVGMFIAVGEATSEKKLIPILNRLQECDPEVIYATIVLMPIRSIDCMFERCTSEFKISIDKVFALLKEKREKDNIDKNLGEGI